MKTLAKKTARFKELIRTSGRPKVFTPWNDPKRDSFFQAALEQNRVLSVSQNPTATRKEYGTVGFSSEPYIAYLIFPKSLEQFADRKIVGIDYSLVAVESARHAAVKPALPKVPKKPKAPRERSFGVTMKVTASTEVTLTVSARNAQEAKAAALHDLERARPDFSEAPVSTKVVHVKTLSS
jgi:hypothetical protein